MPANKTILTFAVIAATLPASLVFAAPSHLTDTQYLAVARCDGLASSKALGASDAASLDAVFKSEGRGRVSEVTDRADEARSNAIREAGHAGATGKLGLIAERDGACQVLAHGAGAASASIAGAHSNSN